MERIFLGIPVLNRFDLLEKAIESLDYPNMELFIINNNTTNTENKKYFDKLQEKYNFDSFSPRYNLGVAASWNRIITTAWSRGYEFVYISSNDTSLSPGTLKTCVEMTKPESEVVWLFKGYNFWCLRLSAIPKIGLLDENFMPAYHEDHDLTYRISISGFDPVVWFYPHPVQHNGRELPGINAEHLGSQTIMSDSKYRLLNGKISSTYNKDYYITKWGGAYGYEQFKVPYNNTLGKDLRWWLDPAETVAERDWDKIDPI